MLKAYNRQEDITEDELALDQDFLDDASLFLRTRGREKGILTPDEIKNKFLEHMRNFQSPDWSVDAHTHAALFTQHVQQGLRKHFKKRKKRITKDFIRDDTAELIAQRQRWLTEAKEAMICMNELRLHVAPSQ